MNKKGVVLLIVLVFAQITSSAFSAQEKLNPLTEAQFVCTPKEEWVTSNLIPASYKKKFAKLAHSDAEWLDLYVWGYTLAQAKKSEAKALGEYWMARSLYGLGLFNQAHQMWINQLNQFNQLKPQKDVKGIRNAIAACILSISRKYNFLTLAQADRSAIDMVTVPLVRDELLMRKWFASGGEVPKNVSPVFTNFANALMKRVKVEKLKVPDGLEKVKDTVYLNQARMAFEEGKFEEALASFGLVTQGSNLFADAIMGTAWSELHLKRYPEALGSASALLNGKLKRTFNPEAAAVAAMVYYENCSYPESLQAIRLFRKKYDTTARWLIKWKDEGSQMDLYVLVTEYLKTKKGLPDSVAGEFLRSPTFLANQGRINLSFEEQEIFLRLNKIKRSPSAGFAHFKTLSNNQLADLPNKQRDWTAKIQAEFISLSSQLYGDLAETLENVQFLEVEVLEAGGNDMIASNALGPNQAVALKPKKGGAVLDWGKAPSTDKDEVWEDEVGFLSAELKNRCQKR